MEKELPNYFDIFMEQFPTMGTEAKNFTRSILSLKKYSKKELLYQSGEIQKDIAYVCQGLVRKYYINEKGNKISVGFSSELQYATDYPSFIKQTPSKYYLECIEPTIIISMPYTKLQEAYDNFKDSEMYGRLVAEYVLTRETDRIEGFLFETAEERYLNFVANNKKLLNRISLSHLASFLGIERQSLSRIRSKLAKR
ncbi:Crp/Fnr family transcriptional regulator [uncultured Tenacibaculum sp.]|uniref:Crp/Fnr family transcriptional regulator n=1 Tax=uncultured Tenacibaculum sp. TaxID=174713 RepID=UPI0026210900|nr:Crp/Fnr family transcriptional regulator [uncultured Tenacibaculum sp.]